MSEDHRLAQINLRLFRFPGFQEFEAFCSFAQDVERVALERVDRLRSQQSSVNRRFRFQNFTDAKVDLFWINYVVSSLFFS